MTWAAILIALLLPPATWAQEPVDPLAAGVSAVEAGDFEAAEAAFVRAVAEAPDDVARFAALFNLAGLLTELGRKNDALARFTEAIALVDRAADGLEPSAPLAARLQLAEALRRLGEPAAAESVAWECLGLVTALDDLALVWPVARLLVLSAVEQGVSGDDLAGLLTELDLTLSGLDAYRLSVRPPPEPIVDGIAALGGALMEADRPGEALETFTALAALDEARGATFRLPEDLMAMALAAADAGDAQRLGWVMERLASVAPAAEGLLPLRFQRMLLEQRLPPELAPVAPAAAAHLGLLASWARNDDVDEAALTEAGQFLFAARWIDDLAALAATHAWRDLAAGNTEDAQEAAAHAAAFEEQIGLGDEGWRAAEVQLAIDGYPADGVRAWVHAELAAGPARHRLLGARRRASWQPGGEARARFAAGASPAEVAELELSLWAMELMEAHGLRRGVGPFAPRTEAEATLAAARQQVQALRDERRRVSFEGGDAGPAGERAALAPAWAPALAAEAAAVLAVQAEDPLRGLFLTGRVDVAALQARLAGRGLLLQRLGGRLWVPPTGTPLMLPSGRTPAKEAAAASERALALMTLAAKKKVPAAGWARAAVGDLEPELVAALGGVETVVLMDPLGWMLGRLTAWPDGPAVQHWAALAGDAPPPPKTSLDAAREASPLEGAPELLARWPSSSLFVVPSDSPTLLAVAQGAPAVPTNRPAQGLAAQVVVPVMLRGARAGDLDLWALFGAGAWVEGYGGKTVAVPRVWGATAPDARPAPD